MLPLEKFQVNAGHSRFESTEHVLQCSVEGDDPRKVTGSRYTSEMFPRCTYVEEVRFAEFMCGP